MTDWDNLTPIQAIGFFSLVFGIIGIITYFIFEALK